MIIERIRFRNKADLSYKDKADCCYFDEGNLCVCVVVCFLPIHSGHQVRWTYQPGSHRRKVTQDFSSTFFLRCVPSFFSREGFSHCFSLVDCEVEFCVLTI